MEIVKNISEKIKNCCFEAPAPYRENRAALPVPRSRCKRFAAYHIG